MKDKKLKVYDVCNLHCAHCGAKIEEAINQVPGVKKAVLVYTSRKLRVSTVPGGEVALATMQAACDSVEEGVVLRSEAVGVKGGNASHDHNHDHDHEHDHNHEHGHGHGHDHHHAGGGVEEIVAGAILFAVAMWLPVLSETARMVAFVGAYIVLGRMVVLSAVKNIFKGLVFDENFLMTIATLGAFGIGAAEEAVGVMLFFRIGEYFEEKAEEKSRKKIMETVDMRPETVQLINAEGIAETVPAGDVLPGNIFLVRAGDRIPLDGEIVEGISMLDTSPVTGEFVPVKKSVGDKVLSGCVNTDGMLKIRAEKALQESMVSRILQSVEDAAASKPSMDRLITRFAKVYTPFVVAAAIFVAVVPSLIFGDARYWIYTALTFLVISCPCAIVLSVPLSFFAAIGTGSREGILFKGGKVMEMLKDLKVAVMDKTGTLTEGVFLVSKVETAGSLNEQEIMLLAASAELHSTHPLAKSIVEAAECTRNIDAPLSFREFAGEGIAAEVEQGTVLCGNEKLMRRFNVTGDFAAKENAGGRVLVALNGEYAGSIYINDRVKFDAAEAVKKLRSKGIYTAMLTGDKKAEAEIVAKNVGIDAVYADLMPEDKLRIMQELRKEKGAVLFVGDGINDAPVLAGADIGAAMGSGSDAAIEAADLVIMNSDMGSIPKAVYIATTAVKRAKENLVFAIGVKVLIMAAGLAGFASMWAAVFADTGVAILCVMNSIRILNKKF